MAEYFKYTRFLFVKWKIVTFVLALYALLIFGKFAGDPTWDFYSVLIMSVLTFLCAPFSVAVFARALVFKKYDATLFPASVLWLVSVVGSYEVYVFFKSGFWGGALFENFIISSVLYFLAGFFWNLSGAQVSSNFAFMNYSWPQLENIVPWKALLLLGVPLALVYLYILVELVRA